MNVFITFWKYITDFCKWLLCFLFEMLLNFYFMLEIQFNSVVFLFELLKVCILPSCS